MNQLKLIRKIVSTFVLTVGLASVSEAQVNRTFVAADGKDNASCETPEKACRSIQSGIAKVQAGGEVVIVSSGSYQPFEINKSVTVAAAPGVSAGITTTSGNAVVVTTGSASDTVVIRGLMLYGSAGSHGINVTLVGTLHVESCVINGFQNGINFFTGGELHLKDSIVRNGTGSGLFVISDAARATVDHCRFERNWIGIEVVDAHITVRDSVAAGNGGFGYWARMFTGGVTADMNIENCAAIGNGTGIAAGIGGTVGTFAIVSVTNSIVSKNSGSGIQASTNGTIRVSNTTVTRNTLGLEKSFGGVILTRLNNTVEANDTNGTFTGPFSAK